MSRPVSETLACVFGPDHEPWSCLTHPGGYRTSLAETVCRAAQAEALEPMADDDIAEFDRWAESRRGKGVSLGMLWALRLRATLAARGAPPRGGEQPEAAWVSPAVTRRAEIAERKALAALLGEAWLAYDLANDAYLAKAVPRPTVAEYAEFAAAIAARLHDLGVRLAAAPTPPEIDVERLDRAMAKVGIHVDLRSTPLDREVGCESCAQGVAAIVAAYRAEIEKETR